MNEKERDVLEKWNSMQELILNVFTDSKCIERKNCGRDACSRLIDFLESLDDKIPQAESNPKEYYGNSKYGTIDENQATHIRELYNKWQNSAQETVMDILDNYSV